MTRKWRITCLKESGTSVHPHLYLPILIFTVCVIVLLPMLFSVPPSFAEEVKVFSDADLVNYKSGPIVDQETLSRMEDDLKSYEKKRDMDFLLDKERSERRQAEEAKRTAFQRQKQDTAVSRAPVSRQGSGYISGVRKT